MSVPSTRGDKPVVDILIVGAGVIGLASALELVRRGFRVAVCDRARDAGAGASGAAAGIVSPLYPWQGPESLQALADFSVRCYPAWSAELVSLAGQDTGFRRCGLASFDMEDARSATDWSRTYRHRLERIPAEQVVTRVPGLIAPGFEALWLPDAGAVEPERLNGALVHACRLAGVSLYWGAAVAGLIQSDGAITGITLVDGRTLHADAVVVAAGAWAGELLRSVGVEIAVRPVRGQVIEIAADPGRLAHMLVHQHRYLVPRPDGRIVVGSTAEEVGFDSGTTGEARDDLHAFASGLLPDLAAAPIQRHWSGLRPGSPDGVPWIGAVPGRTGLWLNTGQFRNGITLAPASAVLLASQMVGTPLPPGLDRFQSPDIYCASD